MKNIFMIINYNDYENTNKLFNNIKDYEILDKILIVDNCSKDDSFKKIKTIKNKRLEVIKTLNNKGYGYAINYGSKYCEDKYGKCKLIISNSDIEISCEEDLKKLLESLDKKDIGVVAPVINQNGVYEYGWRIPSITEALIMNIPYLNKKYEQNKIKYKKSDMINIYQEVEVTSGCFFLTRTDILHDAGYFDENIFLYYEENTLAHKLKNINKKEIIDTHVIVKHNHSKTINKNLNEYKKLMELKKSQEYFYKNIMHSNPLSLCLLKLSNFLILKIKKLKVGKIN